MSKGAMLGACLATMVAIPVLLSVQRQSPTPAEQVETPVSVATAPRFDPAKVEAAKKKLAAETWVHDLAFNADHAVEWQIGMFTSDPREWGYAEVTCMILRDAGAADPETDVRIVDLQKLGRIPDDLPAASLGRVNCGRLEHEYP
jgi:hypothetical protein